MTSKYRARSLGTRAQIILIHYYLLHKTSHLFKGGLEMHKYRATLVLPSLGDVEEGMNHAGRIITRAILPCQVFFTKMSLFMRFFFFNPPCRCPKNSS